VRRFALVTAVVLIAAVAFVAATLPPKQVILSDSFPDGTIPGVLHIHSARSDGRGTLDDIAQAAARAGLKFIVVTDHGDATRTPDPPVYRAGVLCLDAVEISTAGGHYVALDMPAAPYPLAGDARDVVDDVKRLGGFGIVAHPDSPKAELRWRDWTAPFDAVEILNPDTSWRQQMASRPARLLAERLLSYPVRPAESIASLIQPTGVLTTWETLVRSRHVVVIAGVDAHAQIAWRSADPVETRVSLPLPSYDASFRTLSVHVRLERALTGDAAADAAIVVRAIRAGHLYTAVDGAATPPSFEFTAGNALGTVHAGDQLAAGGAVTLHVRSNAPPQFTTAVWNGATLLSGGHHEQEFNVVAPDGRDGTDGSGVYWVEIRATPRLPAVPWITSNPIYVRSPQSSRPAPPVRPAATGTQALFDGRSVASWRVEHDPASLAAVDVATSVTSLTATTERTEPGLRLRFGLAGGAAASQYAALVVEVPEGVFPNDRLRFTVRAERPMRLSVQLRTERGRWQRSVYVDTFNQERTVYFDELRLVGSTDPDRPAAAEVRSLLFVVDSTNTKPGTSGRVWITNPVLEH
jgi:hypothetical protein